MTDDTNPSHAGRQAEALEGIAAAIAEAGRAYQSSVTEVLNGIITAAVHQADSDTWRHKAIRRNLDKARLERERDEARAEVERLRGLLSEDHATYRSALDDAYGRLARLTDDSVREAFRTAYRDMGENRHGYDEGVRRVLRIVEPDDEQAQIDASVPAEGAVGESGGPGASGAAKRRLRACVENWPEAETGAYDPSCCRFPKSCSATVYSGAVPEGVLEHEHQWVTTTTYDDSARGVTVQVCTVPGCPAVLETRP